MSRLLNARDFVMPGIRLSFLVDLLCDFGDECPYKLGLLVSLDFELLPRSLGGESDRFFFLFFFVEFSPQSAPSTESL